MLKVEKNRNIDIAAKIIKFGTDVRFLSRKKYVLRKNSSPDYDYQPKIWKSRENKMIAKKLRFKIGQK